MHSLLLDCSLELFAPLPTNFLVMPVAEARLPDLFPLPLPTETSWLGCRPLCRQLVVADVIRSQKRRPTYCPRVTAQSKAKRRRLRRRRRRYGQFPPSRVIFVNENENGIAA